MSKVLLIHPPITLPEQHLTYMSEPLGFAYLAAYLEEHQHSVEILDAFAIGIDSLEPCLNPNTKKRGYRQGLTDNQLAFELKKRSPEVIGITSNFSPYFPDVLSVSLICKEVFPDVPIVIGGAHATVAATQILESCPSIDIVVRGEGEETLLELVSRLHRSQDLSNVLGISYRKNGGPIIANPDRPMIKDINQLPFPARNKLPMDVYFRHKRAGLKKRHPVATLMTSRGCPYQCVFCSTKNVWKRIWRPLSYLRVVDEIEHLVQHFGVRELSIVDDSFIVDTNRVKDLCREIIKRRIDICFTISAGMTLWRIDEELIRLLKNAGLYRILLPIESGSPRTLRFIRKPIDLDTTCSLVDFSKRQGLWVEGNFIIGFPYETQEDIDATLAAIDRMGLDFVHLFLAHPIPGAELCDICVREGLIDAEAHDWSTAYSAPQGSLHFSAEELQAIRDQAIKRSILKQAKFYCNPVNFSRYTWPKISSQENVRYLLRILAFMLRGKHKTRGD